jgi:hypothetical protein
MPYSGPSDESIPDSVPDDDKAQWVKVWNSTYNSCIDDGGSEASCETQAFKTANGVIKERSGIMSKGIMSIINEIAEGIQGVFKVIQERAVSVSSIGNEVFEQFYNQGAWLNDLYLEDGKMFAVASEGGKLFRASVDVDEATGDIVLGEMTEVIAKFDSVNRTKFRTNDAGKVQMLAISASSVINKNGEIDSRNLFDAMSDYMKRTGKKIPRTFFHAGPEFRTGDIVWMARDDNVLLTVTEFDDSELARREIKTRESDPDYWGDSIEFDPVGDPEMLDVGDGITIPVYMAGIPVAVSTLAAERACSLYANKFSINRQEVKRMALKDEDRIDLVKAFDGDEAEVDDWLKDNVSPVNREIAKTGQVTREEDVTDDLEDEVEPEVEPEGEVEGEADSEETPEAEPAEGSESESEGEEGKTEPEANTEAEELVVEFDDEMAQQVAETVVASDSFVQFRDSLTEMVDSVKTSLTELTTTVGELQALSVARTKQFEELQKSEADKKKEWLEDVPRNTKRITLHRPSRDGDTESAEDPSMQETADETVAMIEG